MRRLLLPGAIAVGVAAAFAMNGAAGQDQAATKIERWIDGDTASTSAGRVRLIGIDTPEMNDECRGEKAKAAAEALAPPGTEIALPNPESVDDVDRYGRQLRYVDVLASEIDVGLSLIEQDLADARYDSTDGYDPHPREGAYRAADGKSNDDIACEDGDRNRDQDAPGEDESHDYPEYRPMAFYEDHDDEGMRDEYRKGYREGNRARDRDQVYDDSYVTWITWGMTDEKYESYRAGYYYGYTEEEREAAERDLRDVEDAAERGKRDGGRDGRNGSDKDNTGDYRWSDWSENARSAYTEAYDEAFALEAERRAAEEAAEAAEAAKYDPYDSNRDGVVTEFEFANGKYSDAWDRYYANKTPENKAEMDYWSRESAAAAVREIDPNYSPGGGGSTSGYTGPRCYAPGGQTWTPCP